MVTPCRIELFGQLKWIQADQEQTRFRTQKIGWILAYLALHRGQSVTRERLLDLFWPEMEIEAGRGNLNNALSALRRQVEPAAFARGSILVADRQEVRLTEAAVSTDVEEFQELIRVATRRDGSVDAGQRVSVLERAVALYRGDLLPGCYEDWAGEERQRLQALFVDTLERLSEALENAGDAAGALEVAQRGIAVDAYREDLYRRVFRVYAVLGQPAALQEAFRQMVRRFADDLGSAPSAGTRDLVRRLLQGQESPASRVAGVAVMGSVAGAVNREPSVAMAGEKTDGAPMLLPLPLTHFFGRAEETAEIIKQLTASDFDGSRLVTILGPGGAGKTRLALEVARAVGADSFAGRVWWVSLADLPDATLLYSTLARALKVSTAEAADPLEPVIAQLSAAPCLLVLDNFEHLLRDDAHAFERDQPLLDTGTALVRLLLERAPQVRCLVTSRRALRLSGEQEFVLPALPVPDESMRPEQVTESASVALYVDRARLTRPDFAVTANNAEAVARLCRRLEGMPLAIEMAAAWAKMLPPVRMLERLEERLDALTSRRRDVPRRHQSLRATIDWSYDLLDAPRQRLLARLSVFRGGWTLEAAESICTDDPAETGGDDTPALERFDVLEVLTSLVDRSLVVSQGGDADGGEERYRLLESVREYASDRMRESPGVAGRVRARHYAFYLAMAEASLARVTTSEQAECLDQLEREHDNARAALAWSRTAEGRKLAGAEAELDLAGRLRPFWDMRGHWREARERLNAALNSEVAPEKSDVRARALVGAGVIATDLGDYAEAYRLYEACLAIRRHLGDRLGIASVTMGLGNVSQDLGDYGAARRWYDESLRTARELGHIYLTASVLANLGTLAESLKDDAAERRYLEESVQLHRDGGDPLGIAIAAQNLALLLLRLGEDDAACGLLSEGMELAVQVGDRRVLVGILWKIAVRALDLDLEAVNPRAVALLGATRAVQEAIGVVPSAAEAEYLRSARIRIGAVAFEEAWAYGKGRTRDEATEMAKSLLREPCESEAGV